LHNNISSLLIYYVPPLDEILGLIPPLEMASISNLICLNNEDNHVW